ncbi:hypothetical protein [Kibdelosporangium philippinense]|uniref:hypothetical protein n=1 Tax=Kibdelosporangium philippinense TaxID=211113 RepID=UPI00361DF9C1
MSRSGYALILVHHRPAADPGYHASGRRHRSLCLMMPLRPRRTPDIGLSRLLGEHLELVNARHIVTD